MSGLKKGSAKGTTKSRTNSLKSGLKNSPTLGPINAPLPLTPAHRLDLFDGGEPALNAWLKRRALGQHITGACRVFVATGADQNVLAYYALAAGAVAHHAAASTVPVLVLSRLSVDLKAQGMPLEEAMLKDAVGRAKAVAQNTGVRALLVHALSDAAKVFYLRCGFVESPASPTMLMLRLSVSAQLS